MYDRSGRTDGCVGMAGVMEAYNATLSGVTLSGPTLFTQIVNTAAAVTASSGTSQFSQKYSVLLIITDGAYHAAGDVAACLTPSLRSSLQASSTIWTPR